MQSSFMDLNEFMAEDSATAASAAADTAPLSIIVVPKNIDFILNATISKMLYDKVEINNLAGSILVHDSKITMSGLHRPYSLAI